MTHTQTVTQVRSRALSQVHVTTTVLFNHYHTINESSHGNHPFVNSGTLPCVHSRRLCINTLSTSVRIMLKLSVKLAAIIAAVMIACFHIDGGTAELVDEYATLWNDSMADLSAASNPTLANTTVFHL